MNELESVDIFCMSEHPKRIRSHEVTASQVYETHMSHLVAKGLIVNFFAVKFSYRKSHRRGL